MQCTARTHVTECVVSLLLFWPSHLQHGARYMTHAMQVHMVVHSPQLHRSPTCRPQHVPRQALFVLVKNMESTHTAIAQNKALLREREQDLQRMLALGLPPFDSKIVGMRDFIKRLQEFALKMPQAIAEVMASSVGMSSVMHLMRKTRRIMHYLCITQWSCRMMHMS